jgi:DNA repair exonuclease SbcCD ATPase subunit
LETIKWKNLLSTGNVFTTVDLRSHRKTLIVGKNGSGKSTILDAITFVLFGKAFRNINKGNLVNSVNGKECLVEIEFSTNGKRYLVKRGIKPNLFEIYCNGLLLNQDSTSKDYQEYLENNILKMTFKSFTQIVILGSASFTPFMQLSPNDRRLVIEDLLDIQIFSTMNTVVKEKLLKNKEDIATNAVEIKTKQQSKDYVIRSIKGLKEIENQSLKTLEEKRGILESQIENIQRYISETEEKRNRLIEKTKELKSKKEKLKKIIVLKTQIQTNADHVRSSISFLNDNDHCTTCKQPIDQEFKNREIDKHVCKEKELTKGIDDIKIKLKSVEDDVIMLEKLSEEVESLNSDLTGYFTKLAGFHSNITGINEEIKKIGTSNKALVASQEELDVLLTELEKLEENKKSLLVDKMLAETAVLMLKDGGIKTKIIKQYIPIINKMINKYLSKMEFFVDFHIDENFNETIKSRFRDEFSYHSFSEGEKFRIDLALLMTWRNIARIRNSVNVNILLLDEVFDGSLDSNGIDEFLKIMAELDNDTSIYVISHKTDQMIDKFDRVMKFEKVRNYSSMI